MGKDRVASGKSRVILSRKSSFQMARRFKIPKASQVYILVESSLKINLWCPNDLFWRFIQVRRIFVSISNLNVFLGYFQLRAFF